MTERKREPARLLIVDDSPTVARVMESVLAQAGYSTLCVARGAELMTAARSFRPDVVFVSFGLGCRDLCRSLAADAELTRIPIVLMSTRQDSVGDLLTEESGIVDQITKPFAPEALLAVVEHTLSKSSESKRARRPGSPPPSGDVTPPDPEVPRRLAAGVADCVEDVVSLGRKADSVLANLEELFAGDHLVGDFRALLRGRAGAPSLSGDLGQVSIADVLQLLALERQSGVLTASRGIVTVSIALKDGAVRLVTCENAGTEFLLGTILVREKLIGSGDLALFLQNRAGTSQRLGAQVVRLGYVSQDDLERALKRQSSELVYELLRWRTGHFEFYRRGELPAEVLEFDFGITIDELLMEGFRRVDEWHLIESVLPSFSVVPTRLAGGLEHAGPEGLTSEEREVYERVDGQRRVQDIIEEVGHGAFEVARVLYRLLSARVIGIDGKPAVGGTAARPELDVEDLALFSDEGPVLT